ncbi:protein of unknown function [Burkholderia multivorans]
MSAHLSEAGGVRLVYSCTVRAAGAWWRAGREPARAGAKRKRIEREMNRDPNDSAPKT